MPERVEGSQHVSLSQEAASAALGSWWLPRIPSCHLSALGVPADTAATTGDTSERRKLMFRQEAEGENKASWQIEGPHWDVSYLCR